jgi:uncharacterized OsmC-like protein
MAISRVKDRQTPLRARYRVDREAAWVTDHARTRDADPADPFHAFVEPMDGCGVEVPVGVHQAIGGPHDAPTPGDLLCAALAACLDSSIRMIANLLGVGIQSLEVRVRAGVDVRGTLGMDREVPVGFQEMVCEARIRVAAGTEPGLLDKLRTAAEYSCVVLQTLRHPPPIRTVFLD